MSKNKKIVSMQQNKQKVLLKEIILLKQLVLKVRSFTAFMNQVPLINPPYIRYLTQNQKLISSCTQRLLQIQNQLQTKHLKQQLVSSLTMKEFSLKKLIEQQDLLILYLKDELRELEARRSQGIEMEQAIIEMEEKYLALGELKSIDEAEGQKYLAKLKTEYNQLHDVLNQMTKESSTLYELKIKLAQRMSFTEGIIAEKTAQYCSVKQQHEQEYIINTKMKNDTKILTNQNQKDNQRKIDLIQQVKAKKAQLEENKLKLTSLQKQVQRYQQERERLKKVDDAALMDNSLLKQTLKDKVQTMKQRQEELKELNRRKQNLQKKKTEGAEKLNNLFVQKNQWKQNQLHEQSNRQALKQRYETVTREKFSLQTQLQRLSQQITYLQSLKQSTICSCLQTQQTLQKKIYFIDQYMLINSQLLNEIQILLNEQIDKSNLAQIQSRKSYQPNRSYQVIEMRQFLSRVNQQMNITLRNVDILVADFNNYKL